MKAKEKTLTVLDNSKPWNKNNNSIWLASTLKLYRNLDKFSFPGKLNLEQRKQIVSLISKNLLNSKKLKKPSLHHAENLSPLDKEILFEHFLSMQSFHQAREGEAFIVDETGSFLTIINIRDHLQIQLTNCDGELEKSLNTLTSIENSIGKALNYAFSEKFGFLTANPSRCGTGLIIHLYLHLPALIKTNNIQNILNTHLNDFSVATGLQGNPQELIGDIVVIHNKHTLGLTEEAIVSSLRATTTKLILEEKSARTKAAKDNNSPLKDLVSRAFGLLTHAYQLEPVEALNAISLLKLGSELNWITGLPNTLINKLFFETRRARLLTLTNPQASTEQIPLLRAKFLHKEIQKAKLTM